MQIGIGALVGTPYCLQMLFKNVWPVQIGCVLPACNAARLMTRDWDREPRWCARSVRRGCPIARKQLPRSRLVFLKTRLRSKFMI